MNLRVPSPSDPMVQALGWALLHSLWQGALVAIMLAVVLQGIRERNAEARYLAALAALALTAALPLLTFALQLESIQPLPASSSPLHPPLEALRSGGPSLPVLPATLAGLPWHEGSSLLVRVLPWLTLGWLVGVSLLSLRLLGGWVRLRSLQRRQVEPVEPVWQERFERLCRRLEVTGPVRLLSSAAVQVPTAIGWLRPVILVPGGALLGLSATQLEAVLAHELAHIRRNDYLMNLLQCVVETLLFYHPAIWWISEQVRIEREHCCDDVAVAACGSARTYALALTGLEQLRISPQPLAMGATGGTMLYRIRRLLNLPLPRSHQGPRWLVGAVALAAVVTVGSRAGASWKPESATSRQETSSDDFAQLPPEEAPDAQEPLGWNTETGGDFPAALAAVYERAGRARDARNARDQDWSWLDSGDEANADPDVEQASAGDEDGADNAEERASEADDNDEQADENDNRDEDQNDEQADDRDEDQDEQADDRDEDQDEQADDSHDEDSADSDREDREQSVCLVGPEEQREIHQAALEAREAAREATREATRAAREAAREAMSAMSPEQQRELQKATKEAARAAREAMRQAEHAMSREEREAMKRAMEAMPRITEEQRRQIQESVRQAMGSIPGLTEEQREQLREAQKAIREQAREIREQVIGHREQARADRNRDRQDADEDRRSTDQEASEAEQEQAELERAVRELDRERARLDREREKLQRKLERSQRGKERSERGKERTERGNREAGEEDEDVDVPRAPRAPRAVLALPPVPAAPAAPVAPPAPPAKPGKAARSSSGPPPAPPAAPVAPVAPRAGVVARPSVPPAPPAPPAAPRASTAPRAKNGPEDSPWWRPDSDPNDNANDNSNDNSNDKGDEDSDR